ncbi:hypothetical protein ACIFNM_00424 [Leucobacter aridicollis]
MRRINGGWLVEPYVEVAGVQVGLVRPAIEVHGRADEGGSLVKIQLNGCHAPVTSGDRPKLA